MARTSGYQTRQRGAVEGYMRSLGGAHATAAHIAAHFAAARPPIGRATVYRHLAALTESGVLRRFVTDGVSGACFQYAGADCSGEHLHLKCESCGALRHLDCEALGEVGRHLLEQHDFALNPLKTVFYGTCEECLRSAHESL